MFIGSSTGSLLVEDDAGITEILKRTRRRSAFHAEDEAMLRDRKGLRVPGDPSSHPVWRSPEAALKATERLVRIARETGARIHILHISTKEEMRYLSQHKDVATCELTPHHLTLDGDEAYARLGTLVQMNPPCAAPITATGCGGACRRASPTCSAPTMRRTPWRRSGSPTPSLPPA